MITMLANFVLGFCSVSLLYIAAKKTHTLRNKKKLL